VSEFELLMLTTLSTVSLMAHVCDIGRYEWCAEYDQDRQRYQPVLICVDSQQQWEAMRRQAVLRNVRIMDRYTLPAAA
jgi:hypothetical protein